MTAWIPWQVQEGAELTSFANNSVSLYLFVLYVCVWLFVDSLENWLNRFVCISPNSEFTKCEKAATCEHLSKICRGKMFCSLLPEAIDNRWSKQKAKQIDFPCGERLGKRCFREKGLWKAPTHYLKSWRPHTGPCCRCPQERPEKIIHAHLEEWNKG